MEEDNLLDLVERIYDASVSREAWPLVLDEVASAFDAKGVVVLDLSTFPPIPTVSPNLGEDMADFARDWYGRDSLANRSVQLGLRRGIYTEADLMTDEEMAADDFIQDFYRPRGIGGSLALFAEPYAGSPVCVAFQRLLRRPKYAPQEKNTFAVVARHLSRAAALQMRAFRAESIQSALADQLSRFDCSVAVVDASRRLIHANGTLHALSGNGFSIRRDRLVLHRADLDTLLARMVADAIGHSLLPTGPDTLAIPRETSLLPLLLRVVPVSPTAGELLVGAAPSRTALITIIDPAHKSYPDLVSALTSLGLTKAQAKVASLIGGGASVAEAAERLRVTEQTVRTTLKHLYARMGISKQTDLGRLINRVEPFGR